MKTMRMRGVLTAAGAIMTFLAGCSGDGPLGAPAPGVIREGAGIDEARTTDTVAITNAYEVPPFDPSNFVAAVDHPCFPLVPGTVATFREGEGPGGETVVIEVLAATKDILGIAATVVRDRVYVDGQLVEDTDDWFAQDRDGNVWYLGEAVKNYEGGVLVDTEGSWEAGVDGAMPGIQMPAEPTAGQAYPQETAPGVAEDQARVRRTDVTVSVPYGTFEHCVQVLEWTPLEPGHRGYKYYAPGIGLVLESAAQAAGTRDRVELITLAAP